MLIKYCNCKKPALAGMLTKNKEQQCAKCGKIIKKRIK